ncbi:MAG: D-alanine--D-alanine ligase [Rickettsiaceae bacterium]
MNDISNQYSKITKHATIGKSHIALIAGGLSKEREVSFMSSQNVLNTLIKLGYQVTLIDMGRDIANVLKEIKPDVVFNCLHGTYGEDGCLAGLLNIIQIPYTHSGIVASSIALNKEKAKMMFKACDINTPNCIIITKQDQPILDPMNRPYVLKPLNQGSSIGVEIVFPEDKFDIKNYKFQYGDKALVEEYISGSEIQVAVLNGKVLGMLEVVPLNAKFYDYDAKYKDGFSNHIVPNIESKIHDELTSISEKIYRVFGCSGIIRAEFIICKRTNKPYILEINTHPGLTKNSTTLEIANDNPIGFDGMIEQLIKDAAFES